jgi:peptidoglycan/xylan/chitin deacetylase (PgdA/CDA1 family)
MGAFRTSMVRWTAAGLARAGIMKPLSIAAGYARKTAAFLILKYHRVNDEADPFFPALPTQVFDRHMAFIARSYLVLHLEELVERMRRRAVPRHALAITFDDGYRDNLTHAAPVLARHSLPATMFLASGFIGNAEVPWFDRVALAFKLTRASAFQAPWRETISLESVGERLAALDRMLDYLKRLPDDDLRRSVDSLLGTLDVTDQPGLKNRMLSWDDVQALSGLGFSIGAHTVSHPILSRVSTQRAWTEIQGSRAMIQAACGSAPRAFAYPNGGPDDYTAAVVGLVRQAGFTCAVTTSFGANTADTCPYELHRGGPWEHDLATFALKLARYRLTQA